MKKFLSVAVLIIFLVFTLYSSVPVHATVVYGLFFLSSTAQAGCATKCEQLLRTSGSADTTTSVKDAKTVANFPVDPDVGSSTTTATEGTGTDGNAWVFSTDLGGVQIQSGTWTIHVKTTATSATGTAFIHVQIFSCLTASEGTCTRLFAIDDAGTNIQTTTTATVRTYTSATVGPFNVHFLTAEFWVDQTVASGSTTETITITTVASSTSDIQTPQWNEALAQTVSDSSALVKVANHPFALAQSITIASLLAHITNWKDAFTQSITIASALVKVANHPRALAQSITISSLLGHVTNWKDLLTGTITGGSLLSRLVHWSQSLTGTISDSASLTALISLLFFHGHSIISCITKPALVCDYQVFFTEAPSTASATLNTLGHTISIIATIGIDSGFLKVSHYLVHLVETITGLTGFVVVTQHMIEIIETIAGNAANAPILHYFISIVSSLTTQADLIASTAKQYLIDLGNLIGTVAAIEAIVPCNLATGGACNGSAGPAIAFAIIGMGIAIAALYFATRPKGKRRRKGL